MVDGVEGLRRARRVLVAGNVLLTRNLAVLGAGLLVADAVVAVAVRRDGLEGLASGALGRPSGQRAALSQRERLGGAGPRARAGLLRRGVFRRRGPAAALLREERAHSLGFGAKGRIGLGLGHRYHWPFCLASRLVSRFGQKTQEMAPREELQEHVEAPPLSLLVALYIFVLVSFLGYQLITRVPPRYWAAVAMNVDDYFVQSYQQLDQFVEAFAEGALNLLLVQVNLATASATGRPAPCTVRLPETTSSPADDSAPRNTE